MLILQNLCKSYGGVPVLQNFSYTFPEEGVVYLAGPSGCGKTTLLRCVAGLEKPESGQVRGVPERVAYCFQEDRLLPWKTAQGNLEAVLGKKRRGEAALWLQKAGLAGAEHKYPDELSGGMRSRVSFARALAYRAPLLLLDEPFHALDGDTRRQMERLLEEETAGCLVLLVTHHPVPEGARVIRLESGPLSTQAPPCGT